MDGYQRYIDNTRCVRRFLVPVMSDDPLPGRKPRHGLSKEDFEIVVHGYACPWCLACWEGDEVRMVCPVCGHERSAADFLSGVKEWADYQAYVQHELENPRRTEIPKPHEIVDELGQELLGDWRPGTRKNL